MTNIRYKKKESSFFLECKGHAGYASAGNDIVCAAISALTQTLISYLMETNQDFDFEAGFGELWVMGKGESACTAFDVIMSGLRLMETSYPSYMKIEEGCPIISKSRVE